jgi:hypothetical protein
MYKYTEALPGGFRNCGVALVIHAHANAPSALVLVTTVVGRLSKWRTEALFRNAGPDKRKPFSWHLILPDESPSKKIVLIAWAPRHVVIMPTAS